MAYDIKFTLPAHFAQFTPQEATAALQTIFLQPMDGQTQPEVMSIAILRAKGADMNAPDAYGLTPLLRCLSWPYNEGTTDFQEVAHWAFSIILDCVDLDAVTPDGQSAAQLAAQWQDSDLAVQQLECEAYRRTQPDLMQDCSSIDPAWPKPGTPVSEDIQRSFIAACDQGATSKVAYLLHLYPDAHNWTYNQSTGIFFALNSGPFLDLNRGTDMVKLLLKYGADINAQDEDNKTVLHYACSNTDKTHFIPLLIEAGADTTLRTNSSSNNFGVLKHGNLTPREFAKYVRLSEAVQILDDACAALAMRMQKQKTEQEEQEKLALAQHAEAQRNKVQHRRRTDSGNFKL